MKLFDLLRGVEPIAVKGPAEREIAGIAYDSRQVRPGWLFVAVPGEHCDGSAYVEDALKRGAVAVVSPRPNGARRDTTAVQVADVRLAMAVLADTFYRQPSARLQVVGVTGTNGKTTTAFLLRDILEAEGRRPGLLSTVEYRIGDRAIPASRTTPEAVDLQSMFDQMLQADCRSVAMEVSSHSLVQKRVACVRFDAAVFTNLTRDHLDYHKTMEEYFEAKRLLFEGLGRGEKRAAAVLNGDDSWGRRLRDLPGLADRCRVLTYGMGAECAVRAEQIQLSAAGSSFRAVTPWGAADVRLNLLGRYNVYNALAALAGGGALGVELGRMVRALEARHSVPGRLEPIENNRGFRVFVDYAHTDDALQNVLTTLREITRGRLLVVFGCGGNRDTTKRPVMGAVAARLADYAFLTSDNPRKEEPREIITQIEAGFAGNGNYEVVVDRTDAIRRAVAAGRPGDVLLIAGKGHERYQEFANTIVPFDDRQVAKAALE